MDSDFIWWAAATFLAFFVKGLCGFANTLVFTSILSFQMINKNISPIELVLGYPTNAIIAWRERKSIDFKLCAALSGLIIVGSIPGILLLKNADTSVVKVLFGIVILVVSGEMLLGGAIFGRGAKSKTTSVFIGVLSGLLCGLYGVGALMGAYVSRITKDASSFKANLCFVFLIENSLRFVLYSVWGIITVATLKQALSLAPFMLVGLFLGMYFSRIIGDKVVKKSVTVLLLLSGIMLIINNIF